MNFEENAEELGEERRKRRIENIHKIPFEDWKELGFSEEQSKELEELSQIGDNMGDVDVNSAYEILRETFEKIIHEIYYKKAQRQLDKFHEECKKKS